MNKRIYFDVESGSLADDQLARVMPEFKAPKNYKKPEAIEAYLAEAREEWRENAALSALTGRVLAIGILDQDGTQVLGVDNEADLITWFWDKVRNTGSDFVGFSIKHFDLPFLCQRSWILNVKIPVGLFNGRYFSDQFIDLQERWLCYHGTPKGNGLDAVVKACGGTGKTGNGKDFSKLWNSDRDAAIEYLKTDLRETAWLAERIL